MNVYKKIKASVAETSSLLVMEVKRSGSVPERERARAMLGDVYIASHSIEDLEKRAKNNENP